jgi:hypothetical protein
MDTIDYTEIGFLIVLFVGVIISTYYFYVYYTGYYQCKNSTENVWCPVFYCPNYSKDGQEFSGTQCYDINTKIGEKVAYRMGTDGKHMCQPYNNTNAVPKKTN